MNKPSPLIKLEDASVVFSAGDHDTYALNKASLLVKKGEFLAIEGPSGSGKTTLLGVLGLLVPTTTGIYELEGQDTIHLSRKERRLRRCTMIGFVFQDARLVSSINVQKNVELPMRLTGSTTRTERQDRALQLLESVGVEHRRDHLPHQISGGERQRVAIARALANSPSVLLADEPTGRLDSKAAASVLEIIQGLYAAGQTIVMVTHNPKHAQLADRRIRLSDGCIEDQAATSATITV